MCTLMRAGVFIYYIIIIHTWLVTKGQKFHDRYERRTGTSFTPAPGNNRSFSFHCVRGLGILCCIYIHIYIYLVYTCVASWRRHRPRRRLRPYGRTRTHARCAERRYKIITTRRSLPPPAVCTYVRASVVPPRNDDDVTVRFSRRVLDAHV